MLLVSCWLLVVVGCCVCNVGWVVLVACRVVIVWWFVGCLWFVTRCLLVGCSFLVSC